MSPVTSSSMRISPLAAESAGLADVARDMPAMEGVGMASIAATRSPTLPACRHRVVELSTGVNQAQEKATCSDVDVPEASNRVSTGAHVPQTKRLGFLFV